MKPKINVQDQFLNQARREHVQVRVDLLDGQKLTGFIRSFDNYCVIFDCDAYYLVYKHAISNINAEKGGKLAVVVGDQKGSDDRSR
jgi:host factor-I protein